MQSALSGEDSLLLTRALLMLERTMNLFGGREGEGREVGREGREGEGRGRGEREGGEGGKGQ